MTSLRDPGTEPDTWPMTADEDGMRGPVPRHPRSRGLILLRGVPRQGPWSGAPDRGPSEARQRLALVAEDIENLLQLGQNQQILHLAVRVEELEGRAFLAGALVARHQLSDAGAVHVRDAAQIEDDVLASLVQERVDRLAQFDVPLADGDFPGEIDDCDFSVVP